MLTAVGEGRSVCLEEVGRTRKDGIDMRGNSNEGEVAPLYNELLRSNSRINILVNGS